MSQDISPSSRPFHSRLRESAAMEDGLVLFNASYTVYEYVDLAKRILLEHRVRDFTAADVVALATLLESRDRYERDHDEGLA